MVERVDAFETSPGQRIELEAPIISTNAKAASSTWVEAVLRRHPELLDGDDLDAVESYLAKKIKPELRPCNKPWGCDMRIDTVVRCDTSTDKYSIDAVKAICPFLRVANETEAVEYESRCAANYDRIPSTFSQFVIQAVSAIEQSTEVIEAATLRLDHFC